MSELCREFGISRKSGYKLKKRYEELGPRGLYDRSRRPVHSPHRTPTDIVDRVVAFRKLHPTWGPKKLRRRLEELEPEVRWPAPSTMGELLKDAGVVEGRKRRRRAWPTPASVRQPSSGPNELWCMDFKGQFRLRNKKYCYPLTVSDHFSRFLVGCEALEGTCTDPTARALEVVFRDYGLPQRIRTDNGSPFASTGLAGLTRLSVWLMRLGIVHERIEPGHPEQNGRHERIHRTLKEDTTRPAGQNLLQQQERFDEFRRCYNDERPHEGLQMDTPARRYERSNRDLPAVLEPPEYPTHDDVKTISQAGALRLAGRDIYVSKALTGQLVGLRELNSDTWLLSFLETDLGYIDTTQKTVIPIPHDSGNPAL